MNTSNIEQELVAMLQEPGRSYTGATLVDAFLYKNYHSQEPLDGPARVALLRLMASGKVVQEAGWRLRVV